MLKIYLLHGNSSVCSKANTGQNETIEACSVCIPTENVTNSGNVSLLRTSIPIDTVFSLSDDVSVMMQSGDNVFEIFYNERKFKETFFNYMVLTVPVDLAPFGPWVSAGAVIFMSLINTRSVRERRRVKPYEIVTPRHMGENENETTGIFTALSMSYITGLIVRLRPANERRRYNVTPSLIGWAHI